MQVVYHLGAHNTDEDRLLNSLLKNKVLLAQMGVVVPEPGRYRSLIRKTIKTLDGAPASEETQETLLDAIIDEDDVARLVLSNEHFISIHHRIFDGGMLYGLTESKIKGLSNLFPDDGVEFHLAIRNPATFIPAVFARVKKSDFATFMHGTDPMNIFWSEMIKRIRHANPSAKVTVWCNEDTPLLWAQLIRELAGVDANVKLDGNVDLLSAIMSKEGMTRFQSYLETHPPRNDIQLQRIISAFLDKYAIENEIEVELDLPGWSEDLVDAMTEQYEEDLSEIQRIPGVNFIAP